MVVVIFKRKLSFSKELSANNFKMFKSLMFNCKVPHKNLCNPLGSGQMNLERNVTTLTNYETGFI